MERGDIYMVNLDPTIGHEQKGQRPVLVVSSRPFNMLTNTPIVVPITNGGNFARVQGFAVSLANTGMEIQGVVRCDQPRALDLRARQARKVEAVPVYVMDEVLGKLSAILE